MLFSRRHFESRKYEGKTMKKKLIGVCALCGKEKELTFEHLPPNKAFNFAPAKPVKGEDFIHAFADTNRAPWDLTGLRYQNQQKGMGAYSLCQTCNNLTGTWYGDSYVDFAKRIDFLLIKEGLMGQKSAEFVVKKIHPQRIIKQFISIFCSINRDIYDDPRMSELREFVLDKNAVSLDKGKYKVCMYLTSGGLTKYCGLTVLLETNGKGNIESRCLSEFCSYPLGFLVYFDLKEDEPFLGTDITTFSDYQYEDVADFQISAPIFENNSWIPEDTRSKDEIEQTMKK